MFRYMFDSSDDFYVCKIIPTHHIIVLRDVFDVISFKYLMFFADNIMDLLV